MGYPPITDGDRKIDMMERFVVHMPYLIGIWWHGVDRVR